MTRGYDFDENYSSPFYTENVRPAIIKPKIPYEDSTSYKDNFAPVNYDIDMGIYSDIPRNRSYKENTDAARDNLLKALTKFCLYTNDRINDIENEIDDIEDRLDRIEKFIGLNK